MPIDPRIALGVQPLQVQYRDPMASYNQLAQLQSADTQNQLAQMQMQEARQLAPLRLQEQKSRAALTKLELDEVTEAKTIVNGIMAKIAEFPDAPRDPFLAAKEMFNSTNARVRAGGEQFLKSLQILQDYQVEADYQAFRGRPVAGAPAVAAPGTVNATPVAPIAEKTAPLNIQEAGDYRFDRNISLRNQAKLIKLAGQEPLNLKPNEYFGENIGGGLEIKTLPAAAAPVANAMVAPAAPTPPAPAAQPDMANALAMKIQSLEAQRNQLEPFLKSSSAKLKYEDLGKQIDNLSKGFSISAGGSYTIPGVGMIERAAAAPAPSDVTRLITERNAAVARKAPPDEIAALNAAIKKATTFAPLQPKDDPTTTAAFREVDAAGNVTFYNKFGNPISTQKGAGKPSATFEKTTAQRKQLSSDLTTAITELTDITKDGGLIDQSTGSGAGRLVDIAARFGGKAMPGDIAIGKLQPIADLVLKIVPRFEGPQSNADTTSYKQAAAQLADPTLPAAIRKEAGKTVMRLMIKRRDQFVTQSMADEGMVPSGGAPAAPQGTGGFKYLGTE